MTKHGDAVTGHDPYASSRRLYIIEAAVEYLISILVTGAYLAKLTSALGFSDSLTGILTSFISLGCTFQLLSVFLFRKQRVRKACILLTALNELLFMFLYAVPLVPLSGTAKAWSFVLCILAAYVVYNAENPPKLTWLMSLVEDSRRGRFTANKEIVSLAAGIAFSLAMGRTIDLFEARGQKNTAFLICGVTIFALMICHSLTLIFSKERTDLPEVRQETSWRRLLALLKNRGFCTVMVVGIIWNCAIHASTPFYGTYQNKELGFTMTLISLMGIAYSVARIFCSRAWGSYADKHSFSKMTMWCCAVATLGFFLNIFTVPSNGKLFYLLYYLCYAVAMGGINSALINLVFDYVPYEARKDATALNKSVSGVCGFLTTLAVSPLVKCIQGNGNSLFGIPVYAQQVVSAITFLMLLGLTLFLACGGMTKKKGES